MPVRVHTVTVTTAGQQLDLGAREASSIIVRHLGAEGTEPVSLGPAGVVAGAGFDLLPGEHIAMDLDRSADVLWGIVATGTVDVAVLETGP